ncbi:MAG: ATP-dependent DNA ligase [Solirubrobacterales bacterium]|nr:ATP-dependent DNA ligase [Solirubrobacterales bacterium]
MSGGLGLADVVRVSGEIAATRSRTAKAETLAALLRRAASAEIAPVVAWLSGELTQRQIGVGWAALRDPPAPAGASSLSVAAAEGSLAELGGLTGPGSASRRREKVTALLAAATEDEQAWLVGLLSGGLRQGAQAGVMTDAIARAAAVPAAQVRRALTLHGDLAAIAGVALGSGSDGLADIGLEVGRPLSPMLAGSAPDVAAAMEDHEIALVDWKVDGARVQIHRDGEEVRVFTRTLDDVTARLPEVVRFAVELPAERFVLDAEAIALRADGRPEPFQVTGSRFSTAGEREVPLTVLAFDLLHRDGADLLDRPLEERAVALADLVPPEAIVPRERCEGASAAQAVFDAAVAAGYEGIVVKAPDAPYAAGRRGAGWVKVKPIHTFDLVVLAAEWGSGRRRGNLSNLHLGARDGDGFAMVGKTFKGLTDELLAWQTDALLARESGREGHVVHVRPELVVEIALDAVQTSTRYPAGAALRFARVRRYRGDKTPAEADTLAAVLALRDGRPSA